MIYKDYFLSHAGQIDLVFICRTNNEDRISFNVYLEMFELKWDAAVWRKVGTAHPLEIPGIDIASYIRSSAVFIDSNGHSVYLNKTRQSWDEAVV